MENKKRLIDANDIDLRWLAWLRHADGSDYSEYEHGYNDAVVSCIGQIESVPTVDAVEVVRCKDCKHWEEHEGVCLKIYSDGAVSSYAWQDRKQDDFCSYGERKGDT